MRDGTSFDVRRGGCEAWGLVCVALVAWSHSAAGMPLVPDDQAVVRMYGGGVHAFFSGDYQQAYDDLTQSIEAGTDDPRAFYFRGLAARKLGRLDEAEADFATGSRRETENLGAWPVARSLERVQGPDRLALERYRREARVAAVQQQREAIERRYSGIQRRQPDLLRPQRPEGVAVDLSPEFLDATAPESIEPLPADGE